jgi:ribosome-associated translation inhibitor RaiA
MQTRIHSQGFDPTRPILARVERQIGRNLRRFEGELLGIDVYLSANNAPRGGDAMKAVMRASLRGLPPVSVSAEHSDLYVAISRSSKRLQRAVKRTINRSRRVEPRRVIGLRRVSFDPLPN